MKRLLFGVLRTVVPLLASGGFTYAATIPYSADIFSPPGSEMPLSSVTLTLPKFDVTSGAGTLTNVELFVYWTDTSTITVANTDNLNAHAFSGATASVPLTLSGPGPTTLVFNAIAGPIASATSTPSFTTAPSGPVPGMPVPQAVTFSGLPCPPGQVCTFNGVNQYDNIKGSGQSSTAVAMSNFGLFSSTGVGTFNVTLMAGSPIFSGTEIGGINHLTFSGDALIGGRVVVVYTAVPEPMTLLLVGPALAGFALKLRRRFRPVQ